MTVRTQRGNGGAVRGARTAGMVVTGGAATMLVGAAVFASAAHADGEAIPVTPVDPELLLHSAVDNLTSADALLQQTTIPVEFQGLVGPQDQLFDSGLQLVAQYEEIQAPLLSANDSLIAGLASLTFFSDDQQIEQATTDLSSAIQAFDAAPSSSTEFGVLGADFQFFNAAFVDSLVPDAAARALDGAFDSVGADVGGTAIPELATTLAAWPL